VWAVGSYTTGLDTANKNVHGMIEHYDGTSWKLFTSPRLTAGPRPAGGDVDGFSSVAGRSADDVYAAGTNGAFAHWDGKTWTLSPFRAPGNIDGMAASGHGQIWALGWRNTAPAVLPVAVVQNAR